MRVIELKIMLVVSVLPYVSSICDTILIINAPYQATMIGKPKCKRMNTEHEFLIVRIGILMTRPRLMTTGRTLLRAGKTIRPEKVLRIKFN